MLACVVTGIAVGAAGAATAAPGSVPAPAITIYGVAGATQPAEPR
nr:hypothetical protein KitaXyl93_04290 [Kitasatospora sp. Xyl93]